MTSLHWQTSLQTQKGRALTQSLKGTGCGLDFEVKEMTLLFCFFTEALHGASSKRGLALSGTALSLLTVPARADQMFGWLALSGSAGLYSS